MVKVKKARYLLIVSFIAIGLLTTLGLMNRNVATFSNVNITYTFPEKGLSTTIDTAIDEDTSSLLLIDSLNSNVREWHADDIVGQYTNSSNQLVNATYDASFAGWKLVSINGESISDEYIYPDNDFIYLSDSPFTSYSEITSIQFKAVWGKTIYVRDKYNFMDIRNVFGYQVPGSTGDILTAKIYWDTSETYSSDYNSGATAEDPISTLEKAYDLLKDSYGGKIFIVNHVTLEGNEDEQSYASDFKNKAVTHEYQFGMDKNISGVVTISGKNLGGGTTQENKSSAGEDFVNSYLYVKNTRGAGVYGTKTTYNSLTLRTRFYTHTVLEDLSSMAYRENYNSAGARQTAELTMYNIVNKRLVVESTFKGNKRTTTQANLGLETGNWSHAKNGDYSALSNGFSSCAHIYGSTYNFTNNKKTYTVTASDNVYLNVRGTTWYNVIGVTSSGTKSVNNIHMNIENSSASALYGVNSGTLNANKITIKTYETTVTTYTVNANSSVNCDDIKVILRGTGTKKITNFYGGGYNTSSTGAISKLDGTIHFIIDGGYVDSFYGGGNQVATLVTGDITIDILSGKVTHFFGGGLGGYVGLEDEKSEIEINISGGTLSDIYGGGSGGFVTLYTSSGPISLVDYTNPENTRFFYTTSNKYYATTKATYALTAANGKYNDMVMKLGTYSVKDGTKTIDSYTTMFTELLYPNGDDSALTNYYRTASAYTISDAKVNGNITINLKNGAHINGSVYGGGKNGAVSGNILINVANGAEVTSNIYGGGEGLSSSIEGTISNQNYVWTNSTEDHVFTQSVFDTDVLDENIIYANSPTGSTGNKLYNAFLLFKELKEKHKQSNNKIYVYSSTISKLGLIDGNTEIVINGGNLHSVFGGSNGEVASVNGNTKITVNGGSLDNLYGGGNAGEVNATTLIINNGSITSSLYGGGNVAGINGDSNITIKGGSIANIYGGGNQGECLANALINISGGTIANLFGGGNQAAVDGNISLNVSGDGNVTTLYGGGNQGECLGNISIDISGGTVTDLFGGGNQGECLGNVTIDISDGTITDLFGGGNKAPVDGNISLNMSDGSVTTLYGGGNQGECLANVSIDISGGTITNLFGGGNKAPVDGNISLDVSGDGTITTLYGGGNEADVNGTIGINLLNGILTTVYGGNNKSGITSGDITIIVANDITKPKITTLYGAGNKAIHNGNVSITVNDVKDTLDYLFGGGQQAQVNGSTNVTIKKGEFNNIFGGGDLAKVCKNTNLVVGDKETNKVVKVNEVVYGGGRGSDTGEDASHIITVDGNAVVVIQGMNTIVQNYGSTKLGSVSGDVNVTFDTYRKENQTNPYVTMNGIDRATRVSLVNSYIALENMNESGEKEGIKNIGDLSVPSGSGLKVTATGEISGNFYGGGSFYLDSKVSLTIDGDITGTTELVINPQMALEEDNVTTPLIIKGTIAHAYMIVKGSSNQGNIICTDQRYASLTKYYYGEANDLTAGFFYLENDIEISEQIHEDLVSKALINYTEDSSSWGSITNVVVPQDGIVTTNMGITFNFAIENTDLTTHRNVSRTLVFADNKLANIYSLPVGTKVTMINNGDYYKYTVTEHLTEIPLSYFVSMEDSTLNFAEVNNVVSDSATVQEGKTSVSTLYSRNEAYRFVFDFNYCGATDLIGIDKYIPYLNVKEDGVDVEKTTLDLLSGNIIEITKMREYDINLTSDNDQYTEKSVIPITLAVNIEEYDDDFGNPFVDLPMSSRLYIQNSSGDIITLPDGILIKINNAITPVEGGVARFTLVENVTDEAYNEEESLFIDLSGTQAYSTKAGDYAIVIESYIQDSFGEKVVSKKLFNINFLRAEGGSLEIDLDNTNIPHNANKNISLRYYGNIKNPYVSVELKEIDGNGNYYDTDYNIVENIVDLVDSNSKNVSLNFSGVSAGNYAIVFFVYDFEDTLHSASAIHVHVQ